VSSSLSMLPYIACKSWLRMLYMTGLRQDTFQHCNLLLNMEMGDVRD